jgi:chemotaxis protein histidine kinase CheA
LRRPRHAADRRAGLPNTETHLWKTFLRELAARAAGLRQCLREVRVGNRGDATFHEAARLLHTIKSASMVVPFDMVTRCTHHIETLMEPARVDRSRWPVEETETLLEWLDDLTKSNDIEATLIAAATRSAQPMRRLPPGVQAVARDRPSQDRAGSF